MGTGIGSVVRRKKINSGMTWNQLIDHGDPVNPRPHLPNVALFNTNPFDYGIANLGAQSIAQYLLAREVNVYFAFADTISANRFFLNDPDMSPTRCDVLGLSIPFEDTYLNALRMLTMAGLPIYSKDRGDDFPLVVAGGGAMLNPLPISPFVDIVVLGEGREALYQIVTQYQRLKKIGVSRREVLFALAEIPGVYIPSHYALEIDAQGYLIDFKCTNGHPVIEANVPLDLTEYPIYSVWTSKYACYEYEDYFSIMAAMGCHKKCPYCIVGHVQGARNGRAMTIDLDQIMTLSLERRKRYRTNLVKIFFSSAFSPQEGDINAISIKMLLEAMLHHGFKCRIGSLNVKQADEELFHMLHAVGQTEVTFAPETTEDLRPYIGKAYISDEKLLTLASYARKYDLAMNIYSLGSLPHETDEHTRRFATFLHSLRATLGSYNSLAVHYNPAFLKAQTPYQYFANVRPEEARRKFALLKSELAGSDILLVSVIPDPMAYYQPVLALGDDQSAAVLAHLYQQTEVSEEDWRGAFVRLGMDDARYFTAKDLSRTLPWEHIVYNDHQKLKRRAKGISTPARSVREELLEVF